MGTNIAPETVQTNLARRRARARHLEYPRRHLPARVGGDHIDAGHPFGPVAALLRREPGPVRRVRAVQPVRLGTGPVGERFGCAEVRVEGCRRSRGCGIPSWRILWPGEG